MTAIRAAMLAREALLTGPGVFRINGVIRETIVSGNGTVLPSHVVVRAAALARQALIADAGTFRVAAMVREALVSEAEAPPRRMRPHGSGPPWHCQAIAARAA